MPFTAKYGDQRVDATVFPADLWDMLKASTEKHDLICPDPDCDIQMIPKTYHRTGTQFFAHKTHSQCPLSKGMTQEHLSLQRRVQKAVIDAGWQATMEAYLPELRHESKRYVDVLATSPDDPNCRIAFEIQWSPQTPEAYIERTQSYIERGIKTYWISKREVGQQCFQEGVYNFVLTKDCESVFFNENQYGDVDLLDDFLIDDFVKKILTDDDDIVLNSIMKPTTQSPIMSILQNHIQNRK